MSKHNPVAKAINYMFEKEGRWEAFTRFLDDGRICLTNNAAERSLRGAALGRKSWLFAGSERGGQAWLNPPDLVRREPQVVPGYPDRLLPVSDEAAALLKKRTLANLYNARPAWLD